MPTVTLQYNARSVKAAHLLNYLMTLDYIKITSNDELFLSELRDAAKEAKQVASGKKKGKTLDKFLKELSNENKAD